MWRYSSKGDEGMGLKVFTSLIYDSPSSTRFWPHPLQGTIFQMLTTRNEKRPGETHISYCLPPHTHSTQSPKHILVRQCDKWLTICFFLSGRNKVREKKILKYSASGLVSWCVSFRLYLERPRYIRVYLEYHRKMWRHNTCGTSCPWWCLFLSAGDLGSEKYSYTVMFIPSAGLLTILRWSASQRRATSQPQSSVWTKSLEETKESIVYEATECCRLKEEIQQKHLYSGWQWQ